MRHHGAGLLRLTKNPAALEDLLVPAGFRRSPYFTPAEVAMLEYAVKLTEGPSSVGKEDVSRLRQSGFEDAAILEINLVVSYMNFVNRVADGLGVDLEENVHTFTR